MKTNKKIVALSTILKKYLWVIHRANPGTTTDYGDIDTICKRIVKDSRLTNSERFTLLCHAMNRRKVILHFTRTNCPETNLALLNDHQAFYILSHMGNDSAASSIFISKGFIEAHPNFYTQVIKRYTHPTLSSRSPLAYNLCRLIPWTQDIQKPLEAFVHHNKDSLLKNALLDKTASPLQHRRLSFSQKLLVYNVMFSPLPIEHSSFLDELSRHQIPDTFSFIHKLPPSLKTQELQTLSTVVIEGKNTLVSPIPHEQKQAIFYKFQQNNESDAEFANGPEKTVFFRNLKEKLGLKSIIPEPIGLFKIPVGRYPNLDNWVQNHLQNISQIKEKDGQAYYIVYKYKAPQNYGKDTQILQISKNNPFKSAEQALLNFITDKSICLKHGISFPSLIPQLDSKKPWFFINSCNNNGLPSFPTSIMDWNTKISQFHDRSWAKAGNLEDAQSRTQNAHKYYREQHCLRQYDDAGKDLMMTAITFANLYCQDPSFQIDDPNNVTNTKNFLHRYLNTFVKHQSIKGKETVQKLLNLTVQEYTQWLHRIAIELIYWTAPQGIGKTGFSKDIFVDKQLTPLLYKNISIDESITPMAFFSEENKKSLGCINGILPLISLSEGIYQLLLKIHEEKLKNANYTPLY